MMMIAATVCDTKTPTRRIAATSSIVRIQGCSPCSIEKTRSTMSSSSPLSCTARPRALPPAIRASRCHGRALKSSFCKNPEPKAMAARPTPTIAGSPRVFLRGGTERNAHSKAAMTTALSASTLTGVNGVSVKTTRGSFAQSSGRISMRMRDQQAKVPIRATGRATDIHKPKETSACATCCSDTSAIAFCGDAIGVSIPPRLQEKAKPRRRALAKRESVGPSCSSGVTTVSNSTGAVTFEMVAERSKPSSMIARMKARGLCSRLRCRAAARRNSI
mmetsp:Transcript_4524/g.13685  ORF Transcript_4524/g.13685 Transcript_4524/m.13685 type:complete len:275 (+) Transcript_4524:906-1730(+)